MIKEYLATPLLNLGIKILDDSIPVKEIQEFLTVGLRKILITSKNYPNMFLESDLAKINLARNLVEASQSYSNTKDNEIEFFTLSSMKRDEVDFWIDELPKNRLISFKGLVPRGGGMMIWLYENRSSERNEFYEAQLERLLRTVEVRRKKALDHAELGAKQIQSADKHAIVILFCRIARERKDIRYLNAALKLNDWAFPAYRGIKTMPDLADYLLALAEAEYACKVLLS